MSTIYLTSLDHPKYAYACDGVASCPYDTKEEICDYKYYNHSIYLLALR